MNFSWTQKRRLTYLFIGLGVIVVLAILLLWPYLSKEPTCLDGKRNGGESGVDCGGDCPLYCTSSALPLVVSWSRALETVPGKYNLIALIENQNTEAGIYSIPYTFNVYDENNVFIATKSGETYINPNTRTTVFEPAISVGNKIPFRVTFEFTDDPQWLTVFPIQKQRFSLSVEQGALAVGSGESQLEAFVSNDSFVDLKGVSVTAIIYDIDDNVMAVSETYIQKLPRKTKEDIIFTWPFEIGEMRGRIEIIPKSNIFLAGFE